MVEGGGLVAAASGRAAPAADVLFRNAACGVIFGVSKVSCAKHKDTGDRGGDPVRNLEARWVSLLRVSGGRAREWARTS